MRRAILCSQVGSKLTEYGLRNRKGRHYVKCHYDELKDENLHVAD